MSSYCDIANGNEIHGPYHDREHGFPVEDESLLFEHLLLEINQAGLNWELVLKKRERFRKAYSGFDIDQIAAYGEQDRARLMEDAGIIRNRLKINALIVNARVIQEMRGSHGGFANWLKANHPLKKDEWVKLFRKTFKFTGGEITNEFLMSIGYLPFAHHEDCLTYREIAQLNPPWMDVKKSFWR